MTTVGSPGEISGLTAALGIGSLGRTADSPRPHARALITYDAKNPDATYPPIEQIRPPVGAPNVLLVLLDDVGFGAASAFGRPLSDAERLSGWPSKRAEVQPVSHHRVVFADARGTADRAQSLIRLCHAAPEQHRTRSTRGFVTLTSPV